MRLISRQFSKRDARQACHKQPDTSQPRRLGFLRPEPSLPEPGTALCLFFVETLHDVPPILSSAPVWSPIPTGREACTAGHAPSGDCRPSILTTRLLLQSSIPTALRDTRVTSRHDNGSAGANRGRLVRVSGEERGKGRRTRPHSGLVPGTRGTGRTARNPATTRDSGQQKTRFEGRFLSDYWWSGCLSNWCRKRKSNHSFQQ